MMGLRKIPKNTTYESSNKARNAKNMATRTLLANEVDRMLFNSSNRISSKTIMD
jgi:hypothetical protein